MNLDLLLFLSLLAMFGLYGVIIALVAIVYNKNKLAGKVMSDSFEVVRDFIRRFLPPN